MTTPFTCPECQSPVELDEHAETEDVIYRQAPRTMPYIEIVRRKAIVGFCTGCEFAVEITR